MKSPDDLDNYLQVASPGVWLLLVSIIVLLLGALCWSIFGTVDSTVPAKVNISGESAVCIISDSNGADIKTGMPVIFSGTEGTISDITITDDGSFRCTVTSFDAREDGVYEAKVVTERVKPVSFIVN